MSIRAFIAKLVPSFGKKDIKGKIKIIARKLIDLTSPALKLQEEELNPVNFRSGYAKSFLKGLDGVLPPGMRSNPGAAYNRITNTAIENARKLLDLIDNYVDKQVGDQIHMEGITYQKASILRLLDLMDFFGEYTLRHISFLVASETNIEAFGQTDGNPYTPNDLKYLLDNRAAYIRTLNLLNGDPKKMIADVEKIPEVLVIDTDPSAVPALAGANSDPLKLNLISTIAETFYWNGIRKTDWDIEKYEAMKTDAKLVELRLEALRNSRTRGGPDAAEESVIAGYERELVIVRQNIKTMGERMK